MASLRPLNRSLDGDVVSKESRRPLETLLPLAAALGMPIDNYILMGDVQGFYNYVQSVRAGETLFVAWQHWFLRFLADALLLDGLVPSHYPISCNYSQWQGVHSDGQLSSWLAPLPY